MHKSQTTDDNRKGLTLLGSADEKRRKLEGKRADMNCQTVNIKAQKWLFLLCEDKSEYE